MANFSRLEQIGESALVSAGVEGKFAGIAEKLAADGILGNIAERIGLKTPVLTEPTRSILTGGISEPTRALLPDGMSEPTRSFLAGEPGRNFLVGSTDTSFVDRLLPKSNIVLPGAETSAHSLNLGLEPRGYMGDPTFIRSDIVLPGLNPKPAEIETAGRWRLPPDVEDPHGPPLHPNPHDEVHDSSLPANDPGNYLGLDHPELFRRPDHSRSGRFPSETRVPHGSNYTGHRQPSIMDRWERSRTNDSVWKK